MNKAPTGGMASHVNGQWYEGGEFMPEHGRYCGCGKNRVSMADFDAVAKLVSERWADRKLEFVEKTGNFAIRMTTNNIFFQAKSLKTIAKLCK